MLTAEGCAVLPAGGATSRYMLVEHHRDNVVDGPLALLTWQLGFDHLLMP